MPKEEEEKVGNTAIFTPESSPEISPSPETKEPVEIPDTVDNTMSASVRLAQKVKLKKSKSIPTKEELLREMEVEKQSSIVVTEEITGQKEFSIEDLQKKWNEFLEYKQKNGGMETELMVLRQPWKLEGNTIRLHLSNALQQDLFVKFHPDLLGFLRKGLDNKKIEIKEEIKEDAREEVLYTNTEKFEHLKKMNPNLKNLSDRLGLDPEF